MTRISWVLFAAAFILGCKESPYNGTDPIKPLAEYTASEAREWTDIAKFHAPRMLRSVNKGQDSILVEVPLEKANEGHYIEKIGIMDLARRELAVATIKRERNPLTYAHFDPKVIPWQGKVKAFAKCNKHDLWVTEVSVKSLGF